MATPTTPESSMPIAPAPPAKMNDFARVVGVLFNPRATYQDIVARPTWLVPLVLLMILAVAVIALFSQRVGWRSFMEKQFDKDPRISQLSPEDRDKAMDRAVKFTPPIVYAAAVVGTFIAPVVVAAVMLLAFNLLAGARITYKTAFAIVAFSWMPYLIHALLSILLLFLKSPDTIDLEHLVASNPGAFLSSDSAKWLMTLGTSLDIFTIWAIVLQGVGFSAAEPKKISFAKGVTIVAIVWAIYVAVRVGWVGAFS
jgi:Yip1 domain